MGVPPTRKRHLSTSVSTENPPTDSKLLLPTYECYVASGRLAPDPAQLSVLKKLHKLQQALLGYDNAFLWQHHLAQSPSKGKIISESNKVSQPRTTECVDPASRSPHFDSAVPIAKTTDPSISTTPESQDGSTSNFSELASSSAPALIPAANEESSEPPSSIRIPRGLYIQGAVGTGKSMLMDLFFQSTRECFAAQSSAGKENDDTTIGTSKIQRYHFHHFLAMVHERLNAGKLSEEIQPQHPIHRVGLEMAQSMTVLCLDEMQMIDIADAFILSQLLSTMFACGTVVVTTSNQRPSELYQHGIHRSYFEPFFRLFQRHCRVHTMSSQTDYRIVRSLPAFSAESSLPNPLVDSEEQDRDSQLLSQLWPERRESMFWIYPAVLAPEDEALAKSGGIVSCHRDELDDFVRRLRRNLGAVAQRTTLSLGGTSSSQPRTMVVADGDSCGRVARLSFHQLCSLQYGASDYRILSRSFDIVVVEDIPTTLHRLDLHHNEARRFITLVDELYEAHVLLICTTTEPVHHPGDLFATAVSSDRISPSNDYEPTVVDGWMDQAVDSRGYAVGALASVRELPFAFRRAVSRLTEMTSRRWWERFFALEMSGSQRGTKAARVGQSKHSGLGMISSTVGASDCTP
jgi:predicted ATPase